MTSRKLLKICAVLWIVGWAAFGLPWTGISARPRHVNLVRFRRSAYRRRDLPLNFAYYIPLGIIGLGLGWASPLVLGAATALSAATEAIQVFSLYRYPSITDVILNVGGAAAGIALVLAVRRVRRHR
jgi:VanZ family protein